MSVDDASLARATFNSCFGPEVQTFSFLLRRAIKAGHAARGPAWPVWVSMACFVAPIKLSPGSGCTRFRGALRPGHICIAHAARIPKVLNHLCKVNEEIYFAGWYVGLVMQRSSKTGKVEHSAAALLLVATEARDLRGFWCLFADAALVWL